MEYVRYSKKKVIIGFYFSADKNNGGVYQYSLTLLDSLMATKGHEIVLFSQTPDIPDRLLKSKKIKVIQLYSERNSVSGLTNIKTIISNIFTTPNIFSLLYSLKCFKMIDIIEKIVYLSTIRKINNEKTDVIIFPLSSYLCLHINTKTIVAIHDLQHRINPQFPEVSAGGRWEYREYLYQNIVKKASILLADSLVGKEDIVRYYKTNKDKIHILSYLPPSYLQTDISSNKSKQILKTLGIKGGYIFYPAKFWPHKNHLRLLKAVEEVNKNKVKPISLVVTGSKNTDLSTFPEFSNYVEENQLTNHVHCLGYVNNQQISALYKNSIALAMPTFFGPTNIPVLEAWKMKTPVIYSDIRGCREQLGNAGLLINPLSSSDIASKIMTLLKKKKLRSKLIKNGTVRLNLWTEKEFAKEVNNIIEDFVRI